VGRSAFEGFSGVVPEGWKASRDEVTYSEAGLHAPMRFHSPGRLGVLRVSVPWLDPDEQPGADPEELDGMVREWGLRRGVDEPLTCASGLQGVQGGLARAAASYRIGGDFVEVWFISDGTTLIKGSYVCKWDERDVDRAAREALVGSLRPVR
jgi:hypothetical protein